MPGNFSFVTQAPRLDPEDGLEVLPCPFCGSTNLEMMAYPDGVANGRKALLHCKTCNGSGPTELVTDFDLEAKNRIAAAWNKASERRVEEHELEYLRGEVASLRQQLAEAAENFKVAMEALGGTGW